MGIRYIPYFNNSIVRYIAGFLIALLSSISATLLLRLDSFDAIAVAGVVILLWVIAVFLTDRYSHKYPQRYYTYLIACHLKGALVMVIPFFALLFFDFMSSSVIQGIWMAMFILFICDLLLSLPRLKYSELQGDLKVPMSSEEVEINSQSIEFIDPFLLKINTSSIIDAQPSSIPCQMYEVIRSHLPQCESGIATFEVIDDINSKENIIDSNRQVGLLVGVRSLNKVSRLNNFLRFCSSRVSIGGYFAFLYTPLDEELKQMRVKYSGWLYPLVYLGHFLKYRGLPKVPWIDKYYFHPMFSWIDKLIHTFGNGRQRALPTAELWGRLAYYGIDVLYESEGDGLKYLIAQRVAEPVAARNPSFFAVVALEKVGLDGKSIRLHKVRSMYPFSEFLQKKIFQSHGLTNTGKFKNDFRLTDYGPIIRKNWIDEIPGIFDWLRGDIKLVGMRATSPHYLSLYPKHVYDLYIQVKPGLIPPIFDEKTTGFEEIVEIEHTYLSSYINSPIKTDILYFWYTFRDIFIRKVKSS